MLEVMQELAQYMGVVMIIGFTILATMWLGFMFVYSYSWFREILDDAWAKRKAKKEAQSKEKDK